MTAARDDLTRIKKVACRSTIELMVIICMTEKRAVEKTVLHTGEGGGGRGEGGYDLELIAK